MGDFLVDDDAADEFSVREALSMLLHHFDEVDICSNLGPTLFHHIFHSLDGQVREMLL